METDIYREAGGLEVGQQEDFNVEMSFCAEKRQNLTGNNVTPPHLQIQGRYEISYEHYLFLMDNFCFNQHKSDVLHYKSSHLMLLSHKNMFALD